MFMFWKTIYNFKRFPFVN